MSLSDFLAVLGLVGAFVGSLIGGAMWVLNAYHKKESQLSALKAEHRKSELEQVKKSIEELKRVTEDHKKKIEDATGILSKAYARYDAQAEAVKEVKDRLKEISNEIKDDMKSVRSVLIQVTNDVAILKSRKAH